MTAGLDVQNCRDYDSRWPTDKHFSCCVLLYTLFVSNRVMHTMHDTMIVVLMSDHSHLLMQADGR